MKKFLTLLMVCIVFAAGMAVPAQAGAGKAVVKGQVQSVDAAAGAATLLTLRGETVVVVLPAGFDLTTLAVGDWLLARGAWQADGSLAATFAREVVVDDGDMDDDDQDDKTAGAYCSGMQTKPHPVAARISARYGVTVEWVMGYFCQGFGMGEILLALKTQQINGMDANALLAAKGEGKGWGEIWKEAGLVGSERAEDVPPGWLKKQDETTWQHPGKGPKKDK